MNTKNTLNYSMEKAAPTSTPPNNCVDLGSMHVDPQKSEQNFALYHYFPGMKTLPRVPLINVPTPVQKLENLGKTLCCNNLWIKRDDLNNPVYGGNKPRKYEFVLADALQKKKKHIVTIGGIGSNHALANTIYGKALGLESEIYLFNQPLTDHVRKVLRCYYYYGAKIHYCGNYLNTALQVMGKLLADRQAYLLMPGASIPLGTVGFVNAGLELAEQVKRKEIPEPDHLFVAVGSTGTCAGILVGIELAGLKTKVHGIGVSDKLVTQKSAVLGLAKKTLKLMRRYDSTIPHIESHLSTRLEVTHEFFGGEYGRPTYEGLEAIDLAKRDGITLDTTYTGKTLSGAIAYCRENAGACGETILFWNTLNSADLTQSFCDVKYTDLPPSVHKFFDGTLPLDETPVYARKTKK